MIAVFTALKMPLSIRVQRLFALNLTQIKINGNYLALKFLYFKFNMIQSHLKLQNNSQMRSRHSSWHSKACWQNNKTTKTDFTSCLTKTKQLHA